MDRPGPIDDAVTLKPRTNGRSSSHPPPFRPPSPLASESILESDLLGRSLKEARNTLRELARSPMNFLLVGPTGAGKDQAARACHGASIRAHKPFIALNCAAIPDTLFESQLFGYLKGAFTGADCDRVGILEAAAGGFVLLNEITELPLHLQIKLLEAIEAKIIWRLGDPTPRRIDVWIGAATNRADVLDLCAKKEFRLDLYHRLARIVVQIPPLSQRVGDLPELLHHFTERVSRELGRRPITFKPDALKALMNHNWPGNVRELENLVHGLTLMNEGTAIGYEALPNSMKLASKVQGNPIRITRDFLRLALLKGRWNVSRVAAVMGISRGHLHFLTRRYGLRRPAKSGR